MVITGLTRNQLGSNPPRVRIPPSPPKNNCNLDTRLRLFSFSDIINKSGDYMEEKQLSINTPNGIINISVQHKVVSDGYDDMKTTIYTTLLEKEMIFEAETTEEVLIKFAKSLPVGWSIKSCLSCRYGHFCPVGNYDNELFCVTEFEPKAKSDLYNVTENDQERKRRSRNLFYLCDQYLPQTSDYCTYSDYYLEINR